MQGHLLISRLKASRQIFAEQAHGLLRIEFPSLDQPSSGRLALSAGLDDVHLEANQTISESAFSRRARDGVVSHLKPFWIWIAWAEAAVAAAFVLGIYVRAAASRSGLAFRPPDAIRGRASFISALSQVLPIANKQGGSESQDKIRRKASNPSETLTPVEYNQSFF